MARYGRCGTERTLHAAEIEREYDVARMHNSLRLQLFQTSPHPTTAPSGPFHPLQQHLLSQTMSFGSHAAPTAAPGAGAAGAGGPPPPSSHPRPPPRLGDPNWSRPGDAEDGWISSPYNSPVGAPGVTPACGPVENAAVVATAGLGGKDDCSISPSSATGDATSDGGGARASPPPLCAGCRLRIVDKFYLSAVERKWHASCLKCAECGVELEGQLSCYERNGHIFCKEDYLR